MKQRYSKLEITVFYYENDVIKTSGDGEHDYFDVFYVFREDEGGIEG